MRRACLRERCRPIGVTVERDGVGSGVDVRSNVVVDDATSDRDRVRKARRVNVDRAGTRGRIAYAQGSWLDQAETRHCPADENPIQPLTGSCPDQPSAASLTIW